MKIYSVYDKEFKEYGKVIEGYDTTELVEAMKAIPYPESGNDYAPSIASLEACGIFKALQNRAFGGMPIEIGMCWGFTSALNALEYHRDSEISVGVEDYILLLGKESEIEDGKFDTANVKAFKVPKGVLVEVYATSLHYAPCIAAKGAGYKTAIILPRGTNEALPEFTPVNTEDTWMTAANKWLLAHPDSNEAKNGAYVGLVGENWDVADYI